MTATLRNVLCLDALCCIAMAILLVFLARPLESLFGLPYGLLLWAGLLLVPVAVLMFVTGRMHEPNDGLVIFIVLGNVVWVLASVAIAAGLMGAPTLLGLVFLLGQATVVAILAWWEWTLRQSGSGQSVS